MDKELEDMEQKIVQISEEQAAKLDPKKIAFFTMNDGTIMVVNKKEDIKQEQIKEEVEKNIPQKFIQKPLEYAPQQIQNQSPRQVDQSIKFPAIRPIYYDERQQRRNFNLNSHTFSRTLNHCQSDVCQCQQPISIVRNTYTIQRPRRVVRRIQPPEYFYAPEPVYVEEVPLYTQVRSAPPYESPNFTLPNEPQNLPENISPKKVVNRVRKLPKMEENPIRGSHSGSRNIYGGLDIGETEISYTHKLRPNFDMDDEPLPYYYRPITPVYSTQRRPIFIMDNPDEEIITEYYRPRNQVTYVGY